MKITLFKKTKNNKYELTFDNGDKVSFYDDLIVKYNLIINKDLDINKLNELISENNSLDGYYLSIKYINKKLRSEKEVIKYLEKLNFDKLIIDKTIIKLKNDGYINSKLYIQSYINDQINLTLNGYNKIKSNLLKLGFLEEEIINYLSKIDNIVFKEKAQKLIDKKIKVNKNYGINKLKIKINYELINMGYDYTVFKDYLDSIKIDNQLIKNEINKLMKKYKAKYSDKELIYFIKNKLYIKGFSEEEINREINEFSL